MRKRVNSLLLCLVLLVSLVAPAVYAQQPSAAVTADDLIIGENLVLDDVQVDDTSFTQPEQTDDDQLTGQASATLDGATVSVQGIPEGGTVTVENTVLPGAEQALISELEITDAQELFSWEISVQDATGADWQPEGTVELELSLPDVKLHKYTKVYVLHEADDGTQSYIAARVTEEGTLSFVTDGFSSFAGFTVDFDYEGATFSMDGLDSILLSDLMDQLKAPLYVEDVASVSFSDPSLLSVEEQADSDWLLTSLQAFSTTEALTVTMDSGEEYIINVTDAQYATVTINNITTQTDGSIIWYADGDGILTNSGNASECWNQSKDIIIRGGKLEIVIEPASYAGTYMVLIRRILIEDGADVTIRLSDKFTTQSECVIRTNDGSHVAKVVSGSLTLQGISGGTKLVVDGNASKSIYNPLIQTDDGATNFSATDVIFRNGANGGVWVRSSLIAVSFTDCTFESTVKTTANYGGAIWLFEKELNTLDYVQVTDFTVSGCQFQSNAAANGGAIAMCSKVYNCTITDSHFNGCTANETTVEGERIGGDGGAIYISGSVGDGSISGGSTFTNCVADNSGGAINAVSDSMDEAGYADLYSRITRLAVNDCSFTGCQATEYSGGGICISIQVSKLSVSGCDFKDCVAAPSGGGYRGGGAICLSYKELDGFAGWTMVMPVEGVTISDDYYTRGTTKESIIHEVEIKGRDGDLALIQNCSTGNQGGGIMFVPYVCVRAASMDYVHIDGCKTVGEGSAIFMGGDCIVKSLSITNSLVENCSFSSSTTYDGGTIRTVGSTTCVLYMEGCTIRNNSSHNDGGGLYWNANAINRGGVTACSATLRNCTFEGNTAGRSGGGIYCAGVLNIYDCEIKGNTAVTGGGIYQMVYTNVNRTITEGETTELTLDPTTIVKNNTATNGAGIAVICNATASIDNNSNIPYTVKFRLNGASVYENEASENGGGIYFCAETYDNSADQAEVDRFTKEILIDNGTIRNNIAGSGGSGNGGGIYMDSSENTMLGIVDGHIHSNTANKGNGGGIYLTGKNAVCTITGGTVGGEYAEDEDQIPISGPNYAYPLATTTDGTTTYSGGNGGGIAIYGGARIEMTGGIISHNEAYVGGGIAVRDESVMISDKDSFGNSALISYNKATVAGGGIAVHDKSAMEMNAGTISNNEAVYGGGISIMDSTGRTYTVTEGVTRTIEYGMVFQGSGVIVNNVAVNLVTSADTNNSANGGGICISSASTMHIDGGTIIGNKAVERVGTEGAFKEVYNGGEIGGGIAVCQGSELLIAGGQVDDNHAYNGGGIAITGKSSVEMELASGTTTGGSVSDNTASNNGGGIWLNDSSDEAGANRNEIVITGGVIDDNEAANWGGGVHLGLRAYFELNEGKITNNASKLGAGICAQEVTKSACYADIFINGGEISGNTAQDSGGGLYGYYYVDFTISGGDILNNHAVNGSGGGLYSEWYGKLKITGGTIDDNDAKNDGGGLYLLAVPTEIYGGTISNNAAKNGAGIYIRHNKPLEMYGGTIADNVASLAGGGIYAGRYGSTSSSSSIVTVSKYTDPNTNETTYPEINHNTAAIGGGVYLTGGADLTVNGGKVIFNEAKGFCEYTTGYRLNGNLRGVGGGIFVADGFDATNPSTFTLVGGAGTQMAIYGNLADTGADDVFSNGANTKLTVPLVKNMNLSGYDFKPEGWFEDYLVNDTSYSSGLAQGEEDEVYRYRGSAKRVEIPETYVTGDGLAADTTEVYVNKANVYVCMTLGIPAAVDDSVVVDFGLPVKIDIFANDMFIDVSEYDGSFLSYVNVSNTTAGYQSSESATFTTAKDTNFDKTELAVGTNMLKHGTAALGRTDGQVTYKLDASDLIMDGEETFYYVVKHASQVDGEQKDYYYYAAVTVIPATSIYYEDNSEFIHYYGESDSTAYDTFADWEVVPLNAQSGSQDQDRPGASILKDLDADNVYGYDSSYASSTTYSGGSVHMVTLAENETARASFTFTGTGFDIVSLCSAKTGVVLVSVYRGEYSNFDDPDYNRLVASYMVDTYYGYEYDANTGEWVINPASTTTLYQVPVIKADLTKVQEAKYDPELKDYVIEYVDYGYGTYTVELYIAPGVSKDNNYTMGRTDAEFYLDAIRIYNPAGYDGIYEYECETDEQLKDEDGNPVYDEDGNPVYVTVTKNDNSTTVLDAYEADGERWPVYQELRNMLISHKDLSDNPSTGMVFIDGSSSPSLADYISYGPNNEVYLTSKGNALAFKLDALNYSKEFTSTDFDSNVVEAIHIGLRSIDLTGAGIGSGSVTIRDLDGNVDPVTFNLSAADMYYDISDFINARISIENTGNTAVSISTMKITHKVDPKASQSGDGVINEYSICTVDGNLAQIALDILTSDQLVDPIVTPKRPALSFNGMVCYNVFFSAEDLGDLTAADLGLAVFDTEDKEGTVETAKDVIMGATEIDGLYMVATNGVHAKYLGDTQYFRVFAKKADGTYIYSKMVSYSAVQYARNALANSTDVKLKQLVVAMLNYGAEAQKFFGYKTDDLMNKDLTADHQALLAGFDASSLNSVGKVDASKVGAFASTGGFTKRSPAISFKGAFEINYFFTPAHAVDGDMTLYFWNEDTYNSVSQLTAENADKAVTMTLENGTYTASSDEIAAKYLDRSLYVAAVYESNGVTYCSGVLPYSIAAYCQKPPASVQDLASAAAIYGCTAKRYFGA